MLLKHGENGFIELYGNTSILTSSIFTISYSLPSLHDGDTSQCQKKILFGQVIYIYGELLVRTYLHQQIGHFVRPATDFWVQNDPKFVRHGIKH